MSLRKVRYRSEPLTEINMTNLIDIVMVLLIAFILVSNFVDKGLNVNLPEVRYAESMGKEKIVLIVDPQGKRFMLNGNAVNEADLHGRLSAIKEEHPEESIFIQADETCFYGDVATALSAAMKAGFSQVNLPMRLIKQN